MIVMTHWLNISHAMIGDGCDSRLGRGVMWEWRSMVHKGVQLCIKWAKITAGVYPIACRLVNRKKTNTELNKLTEPVEWT